MLTATNINIQYGDRILFNNINVAIGDRDKIGLVGRNGAGKSTMMKIFAGVVTPQQGNVTRPNASRIGYLHQDMMMPKGRTVIEETLTAFEEIKQIEVRLHEVEKELTERTDYESDDYMKLLEELSFLNDHMHYVGAETMLAAAERILRGLGFQSADFDRMTTEFSGGWQMRVELAKMLLREPDYLLLDEPTNHLDMESIIWLESFLKDYAGAVVLISHDKTFLDNITQRTVEIELGKVFDYKANYSKFVELRKERRALLQNTFENQQRLISQKERTIDRFRAKASKATMAQSMQKQLDKIERVELEEEDVDVMNIRFAPSPRAGTIVLEGKQITKNYGKTNVLDHIDIKIDRGERIAFVGQNGQGKTTLAKILVKAETATSGEVIPGHNVAIGYYAQNQAETMFANATVLETMEQMSPPEMRTRLRNILGCFMFSGEDVDKRVSVLSGGERARLAMACLLLRPFNLLVLDEPTNHLDMLSKEVLKKALMEYDGTLIIVSHDRDFLSGLTEKTMEFRDKQIHEYLGDVNYFLEKRQLENMREIDMQQTKTAEAKAQNVPVLDENSKKQVQKKLSTLEKRIADLEKQIAIAENQMGDTGFYERADSQKHINAYQTLQNELKVVMQEWEEAVELIG
ncbi:MAG: ABC-F family ATP-binding cassette domain-containing protein [Saprospiraceae bacterium]